MDEIKRIMDENVSEVKKTDPIFVPASQDGLQIQEFDPKVALNLIFGENKRPIIYVSVDNDKQNYPINTETTRYQVLNKSMTCACCGLKANRCFLDVDEQSTKKADGEPRYHFNFYAESGDLQGRTHLILFTKDYIVPRLDGGSDELDNLQTLCFNCNSFKGTSNFSIEEMRSALFPAYRAYRSSTSLRLTQELTQPFRREIAKNLHTVERVKEALQIVTDERQAELKDKLVKCAAIAEHLTRECDRIELEAQITGNAPIMLKWQE